MKCEALAELISAYYDGELEQKEQEIVNDHLQNCIHCQRQHLLLKETSKVLHDIYHIKAMPNKAFEQKLQAQAKLLKTGYKRTLTLVASVVFALMLLSVTSIGIANPQFFIPNLSSSVSFVMAGSKDTISESLPNLDIWVIVDGKSVETVLEQGRVFIKQSGLLDKGENVGQLSLQEREFTLTTEADMSGYVRLTNKNGHVLVADLEGNFNPDIRSIGITLSAQTDVVFKEISNKHLEILAGEEGPLLGTVNISDRKIALTLEETASTSVRVDLYNDPNIIHKGLINLAGLFGAEIPEYLRNKKDTSRRDPLQAEKTYWGHFPIGESAVNQNISLTLDSIIFTEENTQVMYRAARSQGDIQIESIGFMREDMTLHRNGVEVARVFGGSGTADDQEIQWKANFASIPDPRGQYKLVVHSVMTLRKLENAKVKIGETIRLLDSMITLKQIIPDDDSNGIVAVFDVLNGAYPSEIKFESPHEIRLMYNDQVFEQKRVRIGSVGGTINEKEMKITFNVDSSKQNDILTANDNDIEISFNSVMLLESGNWVLEFEVE